MFLFNLSPGQIYGNTCRGETSNLRVRFNGDRTGLGHSLSCKPLLLSVFKKEKSMLPSFIADSGLTVFKGASSGKCLLANKMNSLSFSSGLHSDNFCFSPFDEYSSVQSPREDCVWFFFEREAITTFCPSRC